MRKKIAYIRTWSGPPIARTMETVLQQTFPEFEVRPVDVSRLIKRRPLLILRNSLAVLQTYGADLLRGRKRLKDCFWRTPFIFRQIRDVLASDLKAQGYSFTFQLQSLYDGSLPGLPHFVYTDHTHLANLHYSGFRRSDLYSQEWIALERSAYHNACLVFTRSTNISQSITEQYGVSAQKIRCIYAGSNVPTLPLPAPKTAGNQNILFVGADWERKGGPELLAAFQQVKDVVPGASLTVIGCRPGISLPGVEFLGPQPVDAVRRYFDQAGLFCMPTRLEPFGVVFVEALAHHLPIVATRTGAIPDFVIDGENGVLVEPGDVSGLAQALISLLQDPAQMLRFGENSYRLAASRYNWTEVQKRLRQAVEDVLPEVFRD